MRQVLLWGGLVVAFVSFALFILSGSTSGPELKPTWPAIYGTNQTIWGGLVILGLVLFVVGLIMTIVRALKKN